MNISIIGGGPGGLYFALLVKKEWPSYEVCVYERNKPDDTFGFGVVFSDETLEIFRDYDAPSYEAIRRNFAYWDDVQIVFKGTSFRIAGNGFAGCSRKSLLLLLQERCRELEVKLLFEHEFELEQLSQPPLSESALIVAADGINSKIRRAFEADFGTVIDERSNFFCWLGSTREFDAFNYFFRETAYGPIAAHCYQYEPHGSTWVIELSEACWHGLGFDRLNDRTGEHIPLIAEIFSHELAGHQLIDNRSLWRKFPMIRNKR
jgi:anthraniloyl-CoA monooxygenase